VSRRGAGGARLCAAGARLCRLRAKCDPTSG
jgi:hypothetical protein